jgi:fermentation-respiration switch protein FrsA (DUF1100 family)
MITMNKTAFLIFIAVIFVSTLILTPIFSGLFIRPDLGYEQIQLSNTMTSVTYSIVYESHGNKISALFTIPKTWEKVPVFIINPAASITKESEQNHLGNELNRLGYATFIIDSRGQGSSEGELLPPQYDFVRNYQDTENPYPTQWMAVDDIFRAFDILQERNEIDPENIYIAGESMGGRYAIISGALQKDTAGVLVISSSGYNTNTMGFDPKLAEYVNSINPFTYIEDLTSKIAFIHGSEDEIVPIEDALELFESANEPKEFFEVSGGHSFESLNKTIIDDVINWFEA